MIERFNSACCYPTLPEVFGKEFSYYEEICAIITKLNEVISAINNFNGVTKEYVDNQLTALESDLTRLIEETNVQTKQELIGIISEIQNSIIDLKTYIDNKAYSALLDSKSYTDNKCNDIWIEIDKINFEGMQVFNPVKGYTTFIGTALNDIYEIFRFNAFTANEYDAEKFTADFYDSQLISATAFDFFGKAYFNGYCKVFNPVTGERVNVQTTINSLADLHRQPLTAKSYDDKQLTATVYDSKQITAYNYDFEGQIYLN